MTVESDLNALREEGFEILGYISYDDGKFSVRKHYDKAFSNFLIKHGYDSARKIAYIQNIDTLRLEWSSYSQLNDTGNTIKSVTFPIKSKPGALKGEILSPYESNKHYIVSSYGFQHRKNVSYQLVIAAIK